MLLAIQLESLAKMIEIKRAVHAIANREKLKMKSLVAEDDPTNRALLKSFLSRYGAC